MDGRCQAENEWFAFDLSLTLEEVLCSQLMAVTMMDIARDLNVSVVTVSKVLRNQGRISEATRQRVLRQRKQLNYQMNWVARSLVTRRTYTIGLLLPEFAHPFFAEIARAVANAVRPMAITWSSRLSRKTRNWKPAKSSHCLPGRSMA